MEKYEAYQPPKRKGFYLDPRTKILFMAFVTTLMFFVYENLAMDAVVAIIPLTLLLINRQVRTALIYGGLFALALGSKAHARYVCAADILNMISVLLIAMVIRLSLSLCWGITSLSLQRLMNLLPLWKNGIFRRRSLFLYLLCFGLFPHSERGVGRYYRCNAYAQYPIWHEKIWQAPTAILEYRIIPLMMSVVKIGDELSAAALTRGLGGLKHRTTIANIGFTFLRCYLSLYWSAALLIWALL